MGNDTSSDEEKNNNNNNTIKEISSSEKNINNKNENSLIKSDSSKNSDNNKYENSTSNHSYDNSIIPILYVFKWKKDGEKVFICGNFYKDSEHLFEMKKNLKNGNFEYKINLKKNFYYFRFNVDGNFTINNYYPTMKKKGNYFNYIDLTYYNSNKNSGKKQNEKNVEKKVEKNGKKNNNNNKQIEQSKNDNNNNNNYNNNNYNNNDNNYNNNDNNDNNNDNNNNKNNNNYKSINEFTTKNRKYTLEKIINDYDSIVPNKNEMNLDAARIPHYYMYIYNIDYNTRQNIISNVKYLPYKEKNLLSENNSYKLVLRCPNVNLNHICSSININKSKCIRTCISQRFKQKMVTIVYYRKKEDI